MVRWWLSILIWGVWCVAAAAQDLTALARVLPAETTLEERRGRVVLELGLSQAVPYRVYTLADPHQLVVELSEVAWQGLDPRTLTVKSAPRLQVGTLAPGWSGLVLDLARPLALQAAQIADLEDGVQVALTLAPVNEDRFRETAGAPATAAAILRNPVPRTAPRDKTVVVIDPGHGGVDPGAEREGVQEATLMLLMARELRDALRRTDAFEVHMTRNEDVFVGLPARAALARQIGADAFVSLHADALAGGGAEGATAYSLAETARSAATALLAERLDRNDILTGVDLTGQDDEIAKLLLEMARLNTTPRSDALAAAIIEGLQENGARVNKRPSRAADFAVLRSADVPSVLVEVGFLSSERDRIELQSPEKRGRIIAGLVQGLREWAATDAQTRVLLRQ